MGLLLFAVGCAARSELDVANAFDAGADHNARHDAVAAHDSGLDAIDEPIPFVAVCQVANTIPPDKVCSVPISIGEIVQPGGCSNFHYVVSSGEKGLLQYACDGKSDWAAATFGGQTFAGSIHGNVVDVCIGTTYPWQDGPACGSKKSTWSTSQRIFGDYTSGELTYTYADKLIAGDSCWLPCDSWADVSVP